MLNILQIISTLIRPLGTFFCLFSVGLVLVTPNAMASISHEPANLSLLKQEIVQYHDSNQYEKDIASIAKNATHYLKTRLAKPDCNNKKCIIILDIDETALSNYSYMAKMNFGGTFQQFREVQDQGNDPAIKPILMLYQFAKANHLAVFFITGRDEDERAITEKNLRKAGYTHWDGLILRSAKNKTQPAAIYKAAERKNLINQGYIILINVSDQKSDLAGGYAEKVFKLPNPFYSIP